MSNIKNSGTKHRKTQARRIAVNPQEDNGGKYVCCCCGKKYPKYETNFPMVQSDLWAAREHYLPLCKICIDRLYEHYVEVYSGDEPKAIRRICMAFDIYYNDSIVEASEKISKTRSRIHAYIARSNLVQYRGREGMKTYDSTLDEERDARAEAIDEFTQDIETSQEKYKITPAAYERWGTGAFEPKEYQILEDHYHMLHKNNPNIDSNQEIFVKTLCQLNLMMWQAMRGKDYDTYAKINDQYSKTFTKAGLKTVEEKDSSNSDAFGVTLGLIAQMTPEEFYKDKALYKDSDNLGDYFDRFIKRPMENLMTGTDIRDKEFFVPEEDDGDE